MVKAKLEPSIKIKKQGKNVKEQDIIENQGKTKRKTILLYITPLILLAVVAVVYVVLQKTFLLIIFGALMFIVLWGWDSSSRICPHCKKWNSVGWTKSDRLERKTNVKKKSIFNKNKKKTVSEKYIKLEGTCKNCGCEFEIEKGRIL